MSARRDPGKLEVRHQAAAIPNGNNGVCSAASCQKRLQERDRVAPRLEEPLCLRILVSAKKQCPVCASGVSATKICLTRQSLRVNFIKFFSIVC